MKKSVYIVLFLFFLAGCRNEKLGKAELEIGQLKTQNASLANQLAQSQKKNEQLAKQIQALRSFGSTTNYKDIYDLQKIAITRFTNIYDNDGENKKETLLVYFQPIDEIGDVIKAAGVVEVQLWDLDRPQGQALLGQWKVEPAQLKKLWFATLITINYRLSFDVTKVVSKYDHPLTVKVKFTDYLSGKTFEEQKVITPE